MTEPYADVAVHLRDELRRAWLRVEYQIRLGWTKAPAAEVAEEAAVGPADIGRLFAAARGERPPTGDDAGAATVLAQWLELHRMVEGKLRSAIDAKARSPLLDLISTFDLTPRQWATLMYALLPEVDPNLIVAYRYLARDPSTRGLDGRLLAQLVYDTPQSRSVMARDLSAASPLVRNRLIDVTNVTTTPGADSFVFRKIRAVGRLSQLLDGAGVDLDPELAEYAEILTLHAGVGEFPALAVERVTAAIHSNEVIVVLQGQRGLGKKLLLQQAAAHWGKRLLAIDGKRIGQLHVTNQMPVIRAIVRELKLTGTIPVVTDVDDITVREGERDELPSFFTTLLDEWNGPMAITINRERMPRVHLRPLVHLTLDVPPLDVRTRLWQRVAPSLDVATAETLSHRFATPGGIIIAAGQAAAAGRMPESGPPSGSELERAVADQLHQRLSRLGKKLATPFDLEDLIVDDDTRAAIIEIASASRERRKIRDRFKLRGAQGISVLFSGHPGVGKTMSGTVLAKRLGLDIYEVDLSQVVSKWLGETEKNLSDVFDAAEPGHVVLLFNEADSLFGKRTSDVKSSNDRYANMETNYLLQRLERFGGLAILTTNLTSAIDQAFKRRFTYDVFFSFPSPDMRAELWRRTLPKSATEYQIDFDALADRYELSGGFIKVACERAAYVAGADDTEIDETLLRHTIERMYRERGKLSSVGPLE
ncbi:MAG: AAA family ATPase [Deltaproteobacteria bacterium]|nr:AAA family ATPase [Deltaproteobacteria bacterium]